MLAPAGDKTSTIRLHFLSWFFLGIIKKYSSTRDGEGSKWPPVDKVQEQLPQKMKQRIERSLQTTSLCYCFAKSTLKPPLTLAKSNKPNMKISLLFIFFLRLSFSSLFFSIKLNSKTIRFVKILNIPKGWSLTVDYSYWFSTSCELRLASYGLKTVTNTRRVLLHMLLSF